MLRSSLLRRHFSKPGIDFSKTRSLHLSKQGPAFDMKHFITRGTILRVYRESLQLAYKMKDESTR